MLLRIVCQQRPSASRRRPSSHADGTRNGVGRGNTPDTLAGPLLALKELLPGRPASSRRRQLPLRTSHRRRRRLPATPATDLQILRAARWRHGGETLASPRPRAAPLPHLELLELLVADELERRADRFSARRLKQAGVTTEKRRANFDWSFNSKILEATLAKFFSARVVATHTQIWCSSARPASTSRTPPRSLSGRPAEVVDGAHIPTSVAAGWSRHRGGRRAAGSDAHEPLRPLEFGSLDPPDLGGLRLAGIGRSTYDVRR